MKQQSARWTPVGVAAFLLLVLALGLGPTPSGLAEVGLVTSETEPLPFDAPVWFLVDLTPEQRFVLPTWQTGRDGYPANAISGGSFETIDGEPSLSPYGDTVLLVQIADAIGGATIDDARLQVLDSLIDIPIPFPLEGHYPATVFGSFRTLVDPVAHLITPDPSPIAPDIQQAFFEASLDLSLLDGYPTLTTGQIVDHVYGRMPSVPEDEDQQIALREEIGAALFGAPETQLPEYQMVAGCSTCTAVGDLFPHEPRKPIYAVDIEFDPADGRIKRLDVCRLIENFDIKPDSEVNPLNLGSKGALPVAIFGSDDVDATQIAPDSVHVSFFYEDEDGERQENRVYAWKYQIGDLDGDGRPDLLLHFRTQLIFEAGATLETTELVFYAETYDGECLKGSDAIRIVPPPGRGNGKNK